MIETAAAVRFRDGHMALRYLQEYHKQHLRRAGFHAFAIRLRSDDGAERTGELWTQDAPSLADFLNAALLIFQDAPGSLSWE